MWRWRLISSEAVYGNTVPLPHTQGHQPKTKPQMPQRLPFRKQPGCPWLTRSFCKGLVQVLGAWKAEEACLLGWPSSTISTKGASSTGAGSRHLPSALHRLEATYQPPFKYLLTAALNTQILKKIVTVLRLCSAFSCCILTLVKLFGLFLHFATFFIIGRYYYILVKRTGGDLMKTFWFAI